MNEQRIWSVIKHHRIDRATGQMMPFYSGVSKWTPASRGGWTECLLYEMVTGKKRGDWKVAARAIAVCSLKDNYSKHIGSSIAQGRAAQQLAGSQPSISAYAHVWYALIKLRSKLARIYSQGGKAA